MRALGHWLCYALSLAMPLAGNAGAYMGDAASTIALMYTPQYTSLDGFRLVGSSISGGAGAMQLTSDDQTQTRDITYAQIRYALRRWEGVRGDGSIYVMGALGAADGRGFSGTQQTSGFGAWADYTTGSFALRAAIRRWWADEFNHTLSTVQAGFSPYNSERNVWTTWLLVQAQQRTELTSATQVTSMLRLSRADLQIELGGSVNRMHRGDLYVTIGRAFPR